MQSPKVARPSVSYPQSNAQGACARDAGRPATSDRSIYYPVEAIPQGRQPTAPREVREERGLSVARVRGDEDDAVVDLDRQPLEQPVPAQRLRAQRRSLHLCGLDREGV